MRNAVKSAVYDKDLRLEAYRFQDIAQPFPSHFHEHYVIGLVENGQRMLSCRGSFEKEESLLLLLSGLFYRYSRPSQPDDCIQAVDQARAFMEAHCAERISLDQICRHAGLSKSTLLRSFTRVRGVTPYRYLESVRIDQARRMLARGASLTEAVGADVYDAGGCVHPGIIKFPVPILKDTAETIRAVRERLYEPEFAGLTAVDFSELAQGCRTYEEFIGKMAETLEIDLTYLGVALYGPRRMVDRLTGSMPLLR